MSASRNKNYAPSDRIPPSFKWGAVILLGAILVGGTIGWVAGLGPEAPAAVKPMADPAPVVSTPPPSSNSVASSHEPDAEHPLLEPPPPLSPPAPTNPPPIVQRQPSPTNSWEENLDAIVLGSESPTNKTTLLADLILSAPSARQGEIAQYLKKFASDDFYQPVATVLSNGQLDPAAFTVLVQDLVMRSDSLKLPLLQDIALNEGHPNRDEARKNLSLILNREDLTNSDVLRTAVDARLHPKPAETAPPDDADR